MKRHSVKGEVIRHIVFWAEEREMIIDQFIVDMIKLKFDHDISDMLGLDIRKPIHRKYINIIDSNPMHIPREPRFTEKSTKIK